MTQYIHGRTQIPEPIPAEKIKEQRELEQKQRAMERKVRKFKRFAAGTCDPDTAKEYRRKLRQAQHELKVFVEEHNEVLHRDHSREKYHGGGVDKSVESDIIRNKECEIAPDKINKFFLKPNAKHSREFFDVGYKPTDFELLDNDLKECFDYSKAVDKVVNDDGVERFSIFTELGVNEKKRFRTVWQKDTPESTPRIITAHREDER